MKKYLKYMCIAIFLFIGFGISNVEAEEQVSNEVKCGGLVDSDVWSFEKSVSDVDSEIMKRETLGDNDDGERIDCCQIYNGYFCDYYKIKEGKTPLDDKFINTEEDEETRKYCMNVLGYDLENYKFSYNVNENSNITNKDSKSIICCRYNTAHGVNSFSCNIYQTVSEEVKPTTNGNNTIKLLRQIYGLIRYLIPVLVIGLSIVDFLKVLLSEEEKVYKEAWSKFVKRLIIGIVILILPIILSFIINLSGVLNNYDIDKNNIFYIFS